MGIVRRVRDAVTGRFTTKRAARAHPATTITETVRMTNQHGRKPHNMNLLVENVTRPGATGEWSSEGPTVTAAAGGETIRVTAPQDVKGNNDLYITDWMGGISYEVRLESDESNEIVLPSSLPAGRQCYVYLLDGKTFANPQLGNGAFISE